MINKDVISQAHAKAFTVSASVSTGYLQKLRALIDRAVETGAAFDEVKTAIQHLSSKGRWRAVMSKLKQLVIIFFAVLDFTLSKLGLCGEGHALFCNRIKE